ncbi:MAG: immunoglobulin domain-containing protein, partial [Verrucomicrobia bacterium]|nr:immunoglobulin domain-containing protein [Verrucomicrobiota bacterium]
MGVCLEPSVFGAEFAGGDGTKDNPWKIKTREQLAALNNYLGSKGSGRYFCLSSDILFSAEDFTAGGEFYNKGLGWLPIGTQTETNKMFRGSLDGRGHVIQNLTINRPQTPDIGLFGYTKGAIIKDLRLENLTFTGSTNVGGLTGTDRGSTFQNVSVTGVVSGQKTIGGLVGYAENTILTRCGSDCQVSASLLSMNYTEISSAGGLMGYGQEVEATECYALGTLSCTTSSYEGKTSGHIYAGGLIGCLKSGSVVRSLAKSIVSGSTAAPSSAGDAYVGGLVGYLHVSTVEDSYTQGNIKADARVDAQITDISGNDTGKVFAGGIAGFGVTSSITRSYSSMESSVYAGPGGGFVGGLTGTISFGTIEDSVAVNPAIHVYSEAARPEAGRISGVYTGTLSSNLASSGMVVVLDQEVVDPVDDASYKDGASTVIERLKTKIPYKTLGWDVQDVWDQQVGSYPNLVWEAEVFDIKEAVITVQPQSVKVKAGETAVFSVTAEGSHLSYVWYHDEKIIRDENENVLMIENAQASDEGTYQVYVFNSLGGVMSSPAELTLKGSGPVSAIWLRNPEYVEDESGAAYFLFDVEGAAVFSVEGSFNAVDWTDVSYTVEGGKVKIPASYNYVLYRAWAEASYDEEAPKIVVQPQNTKVKEGEPLTLSVTATGSAPLSYQWIFEGLKIEGATNSVYEVEAAQASDAGRYIVTITNPYGSVTSSIATVRVTGITPVVEPPVITQQPTDVVVDEGSSFTLNVTAIGTEPLAYQWFKDGTAIEGATTSVYEVTTAQTGDSGSYTVTVSNTAGKAESSAALVTVKKVVPPTPIDNLELIYREVREIDGVYYLVFDVEGSNVYFIDGSRDGINWELVEYETLPDGGVIFPITEDFILYRARADNVVPPVVEPPTITQQPQDVTVNEESSFTLSVTATGTEPLAYQWFKDGAEIEGVTASVYEL